MIPLYLAEKPISGVGHCPSLSQQPQPAASLTRSTIPKWCILPSLQERQNKLTDIRYNYWTDTSLHNPTLGINKLN
jgi:hypothetical protein